MSVRLGSNAKHCERLSRRKAKLPRIGFRLGEVAEIEAQMFGFAQKFNRRTAVEFCTKPAILQNLC